MKRTDLSVLEDAAVEGATWGWNVDGEHVVLFRFDKGPAAETSDDSSISLNWSKELEKRMN